MQRDWSKLGAFRSCLEFDEETEREMLASFERVQGGIVQILHESGEGNSPFLHESGEGNSPCMIEETGPATWCSRGLGLGVPDRHNHTEDIAVRDLA